VSWAKIYEYHEKMENGRNRNAKRFPPDLRRQIQLLEELESRRKELLLDIAYDEQPKESEVENELDLEKMFFVASKKEQFSIVSKLFIKHNIEMFPVTSRNGRGSNYFKIARSRTQLPTVDTMRQALPTNLLNSILETIGPVERSIEFISSQLYKINPDELLE